MNAFRKALSIYVGCAVFVMSIFLAPAGAEVTANEDDERPAPAVILEINKVTDGSEPIPGFTWEQFVEGTSVPSVLNSDGFERGDGPVSTGFSAARTPLAAWARATPTGYEVVFARFQHGSWTEPVTVASGSGDRLDPSLAVDEEGAIHLVYWVRTGSAANVEYRKGTPDGAVWQTPSVVSLPGELAVRPSIVVPGGHVMIAYESHLAGFESTPRQVVVAERLADEWSTTVISETLHSAANHVEIHVSRSGIWLDWIDANDEMAWSTRDAGGAWNEPVVESFDGVEDRDYHVRGRIKAAARSQ